MLGTIPMQTAISDGRRVLQKRAAAWRIRSHPAGPSSTVRHFWRQFLETSMRKDRLFVQLRAATSPEACLALAEQIATVDRDLADLNTLLSRAEREHAENAR